VTSDLPLEGCFTYASGLLVMSDLFVLVVMLLLSLKKALRKKRKISRLTGTFGPNGKPSFADSGYYRLYAGPMDMIADVFNKCSKKLEENTRKVEGFAGNVWQHCKSFSLSPGQLSHILGQNFY